MAQATGLAIAQQGQTLVYGGGRSGLMGVVADSAIAAGGQVIGIIPQALVDRELAHTGLTELYVVNDMHE
ncbi:LOG family protein, partial [uncultured Acinetobacter sp.]|uniref:LOG family protein n=1 Tax=uncultured Acinetobacter sp. TaxID=165433 RepID=UPI0025DA2F1C